jgi:hypothetical protein
MAHITVTTSSNIDKWLRKFEKKVNTLRQDVTDEPRKQAKIGQMLGKALAPKDTGTLINAISFKVMEKGKTSARAMIWVQPLPNPKGGKHAGRYASIHHQINPGQKSMPTLPGQKKPSTGDFHWAYIVKEELARRYGIAMRNHVKRFRQ